jgi:Tol biopolymer transport system component
VFWRWRRKAKRFRIEIVVDTSNIASAGEFTAPPGVTIDRIEMGHDGKTILINALDANAASRLFALTIGQREARELAIDQYNAQLPPRPPVIRSVGEMSVSPDAKWVLFKGIVGTGEELFVANVETGARLQISNLYQLGGFEESVETEGGRRVIEAAWSSDGRYVIFNPMQSCSETGLCYGRLFLVSAFGGAQLQLSVEMMVNLPTEWTKEGNLLVYDDGSRVIAADTQGFPKALSEGNHPKLQPIQ